MKDINKAEKIYIPFSPPFEDIDEKTGAVHMGDFENCGVCDKRRNELENEGKEVYRYCSTCCNNDY